MELQGRVYWRYHSVLKKLKKPEQGIRYNRMQISLTLKQIESVKQVQVMELCTLTLINDCDEAKLTARKTPAPHCSSPFASYALL